MVYPALGDLRAEPLSGAHAGVICRILFRFAKSVVGYGNGFLGPASAASDGGDLGEGALSRDRHVTGCTRRPCHHSEPLRRSRSYDSRSSCLDGAMSLHRAARPIATLVYFYVVRLHFGACRPFRGLKSDLDFRSFGHTRRRNHHWRARLRHRADRDVSAQRIRRHAYKT
jgi:hypothetical protein